MGQRMTAPAGTVTGFGSMNNYSNNGNNSLTTVGTIETQLFKNTKIYMEATGNAMTFVIHGSIDGGTSWLPGNVVNETSIGAAANNTQVVSSYYTNLRIQARPTTGGQNGTLATKWAGANF